MLAGADLGSGRKRFIWSAYSSIHTRIARHLFLVEGGAPGHPHPPPIPPNTWPTREQGMSSMLPPHCHT